jgi:hypothetical protein
VSCHSINFTYQSIRLGQVGREKVLYEGGGTSKTHQLRRLRVFVNFDIHSKEDRGFLSGQLLGDRLVLYELFMPSSRSLIIYSLKSTKSFENLFEQLTKMKKTPPFFHNLPKSSRKNCEFNNLINILILLHVKYLIKIRDRITKTRFELKTSTLILYMLNHYLSHKLKLIENDEFNQY